MAKFPRLAGQRADYLEKQIRDFRTGHRSNDGGQMATAATEINEEQVAEVARYFASQRPPEPAVVTVEVSVSNRAETLFISGDAQAGIAPCAQCHLSGRAGENGAVAPHLTAQHESYIAKQLRDFRAGDRNNDAGGHMRNVALRLSDGDIAALARYLAARPREGKPHE